MIPLIVGSLIAVLVIAWLPRAQVWPLERSGVARDRVAELRNEYRKTATQVCGGALLVFGAYLSLSEAERQWSDYAAKERLQLAERYDMATRQLASAERVERLAGIFALEQLMQHSEQDHWPIVQLLAAVIRDERPVPADHVESCAPPADDVELAVDIQGMLTAIARRDPLVLEEARVGERRIGLRAADLTGAHLVEARFADAILRDAVLAGATLRNADLRRASLHGACLRDAAFDGACLVGADLRDADVTREQLALAHVDATTRLPAALAPSPPMTAPTACRYCESPPDPRDG